MKSLPVWVVAVVLIVFSGFVGYFCGVKAAAVGAEIQTTSAEKTITTTITGPIVSVEKVITSTVEKLLTTTIIQTHTETALAPPKTITAFSTQPTTTTVTQITTATVTQPTTVTLTHTTTATYTITATANPIGVVEADVVAKVYHVVDGDTFDCFPCGRVRLADIDAPERGEAGYTEAKQALTQLILGKEVYLDVDDVNVMDSYYRIVCVAYLPCNSTHLLNVNLWLVHEGYAAVSDYNNEFNPNEWTLLTAVKQTP
ncbi:MAG: thermonuclease family protein [Nitrososphaerota archaeon]